MTNALAWIAYGIAAVGVVLILVNRGVAADTDPRRRRVLVGFLIFVAAIILLDVNMWLSLEGWLPGKIISTVAGTAAVAVAVWTVRVFLQRSRDRSAE